MGLSSAVLWWEEWQLRILVLGSLFVQWLLFLSAPQRKHTIPSWYRSIIWLSYLGSDALAIYGLATLFSRWSKRDYSSAQGNSTLEVVWAPVLLMHLGGQDCITAYNIEDNELWKRHVLTAVSQITVAIYVFCKSWPGGDKRLLQAAILLFTPGILKCLEKPWALKSASINSLVSSSDVGEVISLEEYVQQARAVVQTNHHTRAQGEGDAVDLEVNHDRQSHGEDLQYNSVPEAQGEGNEASLIQVRTNNRRLDHEARKLFVDLASSYPDRLAILKLFCVLDEKEAYHYLKGRLFSIFYLLYTKKKITSLTQFPPPLQNIEHLTVLDIISLYIRAAATYLPFTAIGLFHKSHKESYNVNDVKVTYALFCCTAVLQFFSVSRRHFEVSRSGMVAQYSLVGFVARNKKHTRKMGVVSFFKCKDFLDQHWSMKPVSKPSASSFRITVLVLVHVKDWWKEHIVDVASYRRFNDYRGQWTIQRAGCDPDLGWSLNRPLDESVLLWHLATDLCFYQMGSPSASHENALGCREISNYMVYLLVTNPEMLLSGTRRYLFMTANAELEEILKDNDPSLEMIHDGENPSLKEIERRLMQRLIAKFQPTQSREEVSIRAELPPDATAQQGLIIHNAWKVSKALLALGDENKMWGVIVGVWVEMLCFSASRCRGYLHAKSLGTGPQLLTYVWFLLSRMGMETLPERLHRTELSSGGGNTGAGPSISYVSTATAEVVV